MSLPPAVEPALEAWTGQRRAHTARMETRDVSPIPHTSAVSATSRPHLLERVEEVEALVEELFDPARKDPIVVVTTRNGESDPLIDACALAAELQPLIIRVLPTGPLTWELTGLLPEGLGVFGGAARIWWPGFTRTDPQYRHPLIFAYSKDEGARAVRRIVEEIDTRSWTPPATAPPPARTRPDVRPVVEGTTVRGTVQAAAPGGAEVLIAPGCTGWLVRRRRDPVLAVGDVLEVRVVAYEDGEPVLERLPRPSGPVGALGAATRPGVRPGPHLFRRTAATPSAEPASLTVVSDAGLRDRMAELEALLTETQEERLAAERRAEAAEHEAGRAIRQISRSERELKGQLRSARDRMAWLEEQLRGTGRYDDPEQQLRHEIDVEWERAVQGSDRISFPLRPYVVGADFLPSLSRLAGIPRAKVIEVCVDVLTGRAETLASRELHPLRVGEAGGTEQRVRAEDGAKAWRVSLQINTPSARRLHFWRLPDGGVELSRVGVHDDLTIT